LDYQVFSVYLYIYSFHVLLVYVTGNVTDILKTGIMKATVVLYTVNKVKEKWSGTGDERKLISCEHPLVLVLRDRKKIKRVSLGVSLPAKHWNVKRRKWQSLPDEINELIKTTEAKYAAKIRELNATGKHISLDTLYQIVENPIKHDYTVLKWFEFLINDYRSSGHIGQANVYSDAKRALKKFLYDKDIAFEEIDLAFLKRYERHLRQRKVKTSTFSIYMRTLRAAINKAIEEGYTKQYPFKEYSIPKSEASRRALSLKEMDSILYHEKIDKTTDDYRIMVFSYFTVGMNYTDIARLTWDNIRGNEIHYDRQKIHHKIIIPIHEKVSEVLNHYRQITGNVLDINGQNSNYVFPILLRPIHLTEQQIADRIHKTRKQFNDYLKTIGTLAGVEVNLSSYVLRHTAITNLVRRGVTADAIQALAGHKRLSTTENYIKEASNEQKTKAVNML